MALAFPALIPSARAYTAGRLPAAQYAAAADGRRSRVRLGIASHGHQLQLSFDGLSMANAALIRTHYRTVYGLAETFDLPDEVWSGATFDVPLVAGMQWRYADRPGFRDNGCGLQDVQVELTTAPWSMTYKGVENTLGALLDVGLGAPEAGQELVYNGSCWVAY